MVKDIKFGKNKAKRMIKNTCTPNNTFMSTSKQQLTNYGDTYVCKLICSLSL